jgi:hypothetical protein
LCEKGYAEWNDANAIVEEVEMRHKGSVARRQAPLLMVFAIGAILADLYLTTRAIIATLSGVIIVVFGPSVPYLGNLAFFIIGMGMLLGGMYGIWQTLASAMQK